MYLYHGTSIDFAEPSLHMCRPHRDFGCGFYLATNYFDALPMAFKNSKIGYVKTFELVDIDKLNILELDGYSDEWLMFVVGARLGSKSHYDLVIGNMAGGGSNLQSKFAKFRHTGAEAPDVIKVMRNELTNTSLGIQYALLTQLALSKLKLIKTETIERE